MKTMMMIFSAAAVLLLAGCKTTEETRPLTWQDQQAFAAKVKDPRYFGYSIYQTPAGIEYRGGCRLHPNQAKILPMIAVDPVRPVVMIAGKFGKETPVLLDFCSTVSWLEFDLARSLRAVPVSEQKAQLVRVPGDEIPGCLSVVPTLKLDQIFIENPQVMVRMANGPLGSLARDVTDPAPKGVIGWNILGQFEQIHLDYAGRQVALTTTKAAYEPNPSRLAAALPLVKHAGVCAVRGTVDGKPGLILIDPAGDFEVATDGGAPVQSLRLSSGMEFSAPVAAVSPGGTRIGARLLQSFKVTVCPQNGEIFFETLPPDEK